MDIFLVFVGCCAAVCCVMRAMHGACARLFDTVHIGVRTNAFILFLIESFDIYLYASQPACSPNGVQFFFLLVLFKEKFTSGQ